MARSTSKVKAKARAKAKATSKAKPKAKPRVQAEPGAKGAAKRKPNASAKARATARPARKAAARRPAAKRPAPRRTAAKPAVRAPAGGARAGSKRILDLAQVIRSKNAGPFEVTFDIMFDSADNYRMVRDSGVISRKLVARLYGISENAVLVCRPYDPAQAIKITIRRPVSSGDIGDSDVYGCQQHVPLTAIAVPV